MNTQTEAQVHKCHKRTTFSLLEDAMLIHLVKQYGSNWNAVAKRFPSRTARQCKERWELYLNPDINLTSWSDEEDKKLEELVKIHGRSWASISPYFSGRTVVNIKNRYNVIERRNKRKERAYEIKSSLNTIEAAAPIENIPNESLFDPENSFISYDLDMFEECFLL